MNIAVLDTGLFPAREEIEESVNLLEPHYNLYRWNLREADLTEQDWDQIVDELLTADRVILV